MARSRTGPSSRSANLSILQMQSAVPKIERRIAELQAFDIQSIHERNDSRIDGLETKIHTLISSVFSADTIEYEKYIRLAHIYRGSININYETPIHEIREAIKGSIDKAISSLDSLRSVFNEEIEDSGLSIATKPLRAYEGLDLHPAIERAAGKLFRDGHYSNAIEDAVKALNALVRLNSGVDDKDGTTLMQHVFSPKNPILMVNTLADKSDEDEQQGMMMMFSGAVAGLRNPRAHKLIQDDAERTLEFIAFISLLAKIADKATK